MAKMEERREERGKRRRKGEGEREREPHCPTCLETTALPVPVPSLNTSNALPPVSLTSGLCPRKGYNFYPSGMPSQPSQQRWQEGETPSPSSVSWGNPRKGKLGTHPNPASPPVSPQDVPS